MALHLVHSWNYLGCLQQVLCLGDGEVGDANGLHYRSLLTSPVDYNNIKADHLEAIVLQSYHEANDKSFCKCCYLEFQGDLYHSH